MNMRFSSNRERVIPQDKGLNVAIIGTGKVGTDLLVKVLRSKLLHCCLFSGRNDQSEGMLYAHKLGVPCSSDSIDAIMALSDEVDLVFDATSADQHRIHAPLFESKDILAVDLTPSKVGSSCVPTISLEPLAFAKNVNMITCGGQVSIPIAKSVSTHLSGIYRLEVSSTLVEASVGQATLDNIDQYYQTTQEELYHHSRIPTIEVKLGTCSDTSQDGMRTVLRFFTETAPGFKVVREIEKSVDRVRSYVPGYKLAYRPYYNQGVFEVVVEVEGQGDYLPKNAGNLDIINCAAIVAAERFAEQKRRRSFSTVLNPFKSVLGRAV